MGIRHIFEECLQILAIYMMIDQIQRCGQGAIRGMGMQKVGAMANVLSYYCIGIPLGLYLCFKRDWKVDGLWIGMCAASIVSSVVFVVVRMRVNWREQVKRAFARMNEKERNMELYKDKFVAKNGMDRFKVQIDSDGEYEDSSTDLNTTLS